MMFTAVKILQALLLPPGIFLILMAVGFAVRKDCRLLGRLSIASGFLLLYLVSTAPVSDALLAPLESSCAPLREPPAKGKADAVVVLGGGVRNLSWLSLDPEPSESSLERVVEGVRLFRRTRLPLLMVGGNGDPAKEGISEAESMARTAAGLGVPSRSLVVVSGPRSTLESVSAVKEHLKGRRVVLVTSAFHMRRAAAMFRKKGFDVIPAPCGYRAERLRRSFLSWIPRAGSLASSSTALSEYVSLAWYRISGDL